MLSLLSLLQQIPNKMLTTIKGIYDHGKIILTEDSPIKTKSDVIVTFLPNTDMEQAKKSKDKQHIILGMLDGKIDTPDDFNEPLDDLKEYM